MENRKCSYLLIFSLLFFLVFSSGLLFANSAVSANTLQLINLEEENTNNLITSNFDSSEAEFQKLKLALNSVSNPYNIYVLEYQLPLPFLALIREDHELIRLFAEYEINYNFSRFKIDDEFYSPLAYYISQGGNNRETIDLLIELGMNPYLERTGRSGIWHAVISGNNEGLAYLLDLGVDPNPVVNLKSPVREATARGNFAALAMLLDANADIFYRDSSGNTSWELIKAKAESTNSIQAEEVLNKTEEILSGIWSETAVHISDAQRLLDYPEFFIENRFTNLSLRYGILDLGFKGLKEWLETHPEEKALTSFAYDTSNDSSEHGYWVYRVVRAIAPDADIYIGKALNADHLAWLYNNKVGLASMSVSVPTWMAPDLSNASERDISFARNLDSTGIYLFTAAGNRFNNVDSDYRIDSNNNGWLELMRNDRTAEAKEYYTFYVHEQVPFRMWIASNGWEVPHDLDFELLIREDGENKDFENIKFYRYPDNILIEGTADKSRYLALRVRADNLDPEHKDKLKVRIINYAGTSHYHFNGTSSTDFPSTYNSPYIISIGSFGRDPNTGKANPSIFSAIGSNSAGTLPHISGPGELIIDNQIKQGTSYATPLLGAIASFYTNASPKILMEHISDKQKWAPAVETRRQGAWGIPSYEKLGDQSLAIFSEESEIDQIRYNHLDDGSTQFSFNLTRDFMQHMRVFFRMDVIDPESRQLLKIKDTNNPLRIEFGGFVGGESFDNSRISFNIPADILEDKYKGEEVFIKVYMTNSLKRDRWQEIPELYLRLRLND